MILIHGSKFDRKHYFLLKEASNRQRIICSIESLELNKKRFINFPQKYCVCVWGVWVRLSIGVLQQRKVTYLKGTFLNLFDFFTTKWKYKRIFLYTFDAFYLR